MALPQSLADFFVRAAMHESPIDRTLGGDYLPARKSIKDKEGFGSAHREHHASSRAELAFHLARDFSDSPTRRFCEPRSSSCYCLVQLS